MCQCSDRPAMKRVHLLVLQEVERLVYCFQKVIEKGSESSLLEADGQNSLRQESDHKGDSALHQRQVQS